MNTESGIASEGQEIPVEAAVPAGTDNKKYLIHGLWLVAIGTTWILWNLSVISWSWMERYGLIVFGAALLARTIYLKKYRVTTGMTLLLIGAFHIYLDNSEYYRMRDLWPVYFLIAGSAFLTSFVINVRRWFSLVAGLTLIGFGGIQISRNFFFLPETFAYAVRMYWPLTFVLAGVILLTIGFYQYRKLR